MTQLTIVLSNVHGSVQIKNILIYIQPDATLRSLFYLETENKLCNVTPCFIYILEYSGADFPLDYVTG
jgi:hypothetical protein